MMSSTNDNNRQDQLSMMSSRDVQWSMVAAGSTVSLVALITDFDGKLHNQSSQHKWAASAISISFALSWLAVLANMFHREKFVGTMIEGYNILVVCGFWAAVMPSIMDPRSSVSVTNLVGGISNANLYFFTWLSLVMSFMTLIHFMKERYGTDIRGAFTSWSALGMTSIIVAVSAGRLYRYLDCNNSNWVLISGLDKQCTRTELAVSIGSIGGVLSILWMLLDVYWSNTMKNTVEMFFGFTMFLFWIFGVGFITFGGSNGPATQIGNLYFFTWGSFVLAQIVFVQAIQKYRNSVMISSNETATVDNNNDKNTNNNNNNDDNGIEQVETSA